MKKLLGLLGTITIAGSGMVGLVGNAPAPAKNEINYSQTNNLEILNRNKRQNNKKNITGVSEVIITTNNPFIFSGIELKNKLYFGSGNKIYQYNPITNQFKVVIRTDNDKDVFYSRVMLNNKLYFGLTSNKHYEYDPVTETQKEVIITSTNKIVVFSKLTLNNKLYFYSTSKEVYEYDPITNQQKVIIRAGGLICSSGVTLNHKIYFGSTDGNVYEYDPATEQQKVVVTARYGMFFSSGLALNNKVYFGSDDHDVYEYDPITNQQKVVIRTDKGVFSSGVALNNKVYFGSDDHNVYEYDTITNQQKVVIRTSEKVIFSGLALNNKVYFASDDHNVYEYDTITNQQKVIIKTDEDLFSFGVIWNKKIYFESWSFKIYEYDLLELVEYDFINIRDQIKRGLYLYYKKQNPNSEIKLISNINLDNLIILPNLVIEEKQNNQSSNLEKNLSVCKDYNDTFVNNTDIKQTVNTISCSKEIKEINTFQKMNGFFKSNSSSESENWSANVNLDVTAKASGEAGIPLVAKGKVEVGIEVGGGYTWGGSQTYTIENNSTSSDTKINTTENITKIIFPSQSIVLPPHSKISVYAKSWENNIILILSYFQKLDGVVSASLIDFSNNWHEISISVKEAMSNLLENDILPSKIKINDDDDSINFYYDIKSLKQIIMRETEINPVTSLSSYEQNITFKDNKNNVVVIKNKL